MGEIITTIVFFLIILYSIVQILSFFNVPKSSYGMYLLFYLLLYSCVMMMQSGAKNAIYGT